MRGHDAIGLAATLALLFGCERCTPKPEAQAGKNAIVFGTLEEPDTLDPAFTDSSGAQEIVRLLFRDLTELGPDWSVHPSLADGPPLVETSSSGAMRVHWKLLPELSWSDGVPLTADDLVFGFGIASDPTLEVSALRAPTELRAVRAASPLEAVAEWSSPMAGYDSPRLHAILPRHAYPDPKKSPRPFRGLARSPIGNGPYRLGTWSPGQYLSLEPNPSWPFAKPRIQRITFRFFKTEDSFETELKTGGIDALGEASGLSIERAQGLGERLAKTHLVEYTDSGLWLHLEARLDHPALRDPRVRRAISLAVDRRRMAQLVYGDRATPAYGFLPPRHPAHDANTPAAKTDLEEARRLMADAHTGDLLLELQLASGSQASERAAAFIQDALSKIGVTVQLSAMPFRVLGEKMRARTHGALVLFAWRSGPDWEGGSMLHSGARQNFGGYADPQMDRLIDEARHTIDRAAWIAIVRRIEALYASALPTIPLLFRQAVSVHPRGLGPWRPTGSTTPVTWNAEEWRLE
jgi:peptide/nickel transport system substrate-binding protein